jgi:D-tyrosyl-tRNA(Tyr) deacylase
MPPNRAVTAALTHSIEKGIETMIALIQRTARARVTVAGQEVAVIGRGILALIGIQAEDSPAAAGKLLDRVLTYRIFPDEAGKMNLDITQISGELLLVPQFTLVADTQKGTRPGFSRGAPPTQAQILYSEAVEMALTRYPRVASGVFGADMQVELVNDGPVTFWLESSYPT